MDDCKAATAGTQKMAGNYFRCHVTKKLPFSVFPTRRGTQQGHGENHTTVKCLEGHSWFHTLPPVTRSSGAEGHWCVWTFSAGKNGLSRSSKCSAFQEAILVATAA